jgi:ferredoxin-NADP reductase/predicted pyridoxine 5'-phosphate oxidase superfamily flavin-nucleotide-binding protein
MKQTSEVAAGVSGPESPFHAGELAAQERAGFRERADAAGRRGIRSYMPDQHRTFYGQLPFMIVGGVDESGQPWATWRVGQPGFVSSPDSRTLCIAGAALPGDPLEGTWKRGALFGGLGIELPTRRRNRVNGVVASVDGGVMTIDVNQSFGNCAQYIQDRFAEWIDRPHASGTSSLMRAPELSDLDRALLESADTLFIASANTSSEAGTARGVDVSHRGGMPGFVHVESRATFTIPDYAGNRFLNTIGNLMLSPSAGLVFADFERGDLLYVAADAEIVWDGPDLAEFKGAQRLIRFHVRETRRSLGVLPFRWTEPKYAPEFSVEASDAAKREKASRSAWTRLRVAEVRDEAVGIRSFFLEPESGGHLPEYLPGQFLPLRIAVPGEAAPLRRSYTLSDVHDGRRYRISVKRHGIASSWLHDHVSPGDVIEAMEPRGRFTFDASSPRPVVFLSAGIGITPMMAMLKQALGGAGAFPQRRLYFIHGARTEDDRPFQAFLRDAAAHNPQLTVHLLNSDAENVEGRRISIAWLKRVLAFDDYDFYLCGPGPFMSELYAGLRALNVADERIRFEAFGPSTVERTKSSPPPNAGTTTPSVPVAFSCSAVTANWTAADGTLLEFAEAHGVPAASSCRAGACGTCATRVIAGNVVYAEEPVASVEAGCALICVATPAVDEAGAGGELILEL